MFIIIEWCDGTWKTTLVNFVQEKTWFEIVKFSQPKTKNPYKEYLDFIKQNRDKDLILDRFWIWETIYWPLYRGKWLKQEEIKALKKLTARDLYIITYTDNKNILEVFKNRGEDFTKPEHIEKINWDFFRFLHNNFRINYRLMYDFNIMWSRLEWFFNMYIKDKIWKQK